MISMASLEVLCLIMSGLLFIFNLIYLFLYLHLFIEFIYFLLYRFIASLFLYYGFPFHIFMAFLYVLTWNCVCVSTYFSWAFSLTIFSYAGLFLSYLLFQFIFFILSFLIHFYYLNICFLIRDRKGVDLNGREVGKILEELEDGKS